MILLPFFEVVAIFRELNLSLLPSFVPYSLSSLPPSLLSFFYFIPSVIVKTQKVVFLDMTNKVR